VSSIALVLLTAPNYTLRDIRYRNAGFTQVPTPRLYEEMATTDLSRLGTDFRVPIFFFQGQDDNITLPSAARAAAVRLRNRGASKPPVPGRPANEKSFSPGTQILF
jgi:hypothetical protein